MTDTDDLLRRIAAEIDKTRSHNFGMDILIHVNTADLQKMADTTAGYRNHHPTMPVISPGTIGTILGVRCIADPDMPAGGFGVELTQPQPTPRTCRYALDSSSRKYCLDCGAYIHDDKQHGLWHAAINAAINAAAVPHNR